jgi:septum formation protein
VRVTFWLADRPLVLASASQIRRNILEAAGIPLEPRPANIDERAVEQQAGSLSPVAVAVLLADAKAASVAANLPGRIVVGADQTLALGSQRFTKPADRDRAREQLTELRGRTHELHSAVAVHRDGVAVFQHLETARLRMRDFSDAFLETYLDGVGPAAYSSVGGYQLEGAGIHLFDRIEGDYFTILGLPLLPLLRFFREAGFTVS